MIARPSTPVKLRSARIIAALTALAVLAFSVQLVVAGTDNVTLDKSSSAPAPPATVALGSSYTYTLLATVGTLPATTMVITDNSLDYPQVTINTATFAVNGGAAVPCGTHGPSQVRCAVGSVAASGTVSVVIGVTVAANAATACVNPQDGVSFDDTVRNTANVSWTDTDGPQPQVNSNTLVRDLACGVAPSPTPTPTSTATAGGGPAVSRLFGANRYDTAAKLSQQLTPSPGAGVDSVLVSTGLQFPDALAGGPAADAKATSILLTRQGDIPTETKAELARLKPNTIFVLGGTAVVSDVVLNELKATYARSHTVTRLAGADRYESAKAIVDNAFPDPVSDVMIADGTNFPDALAGGAAAAANNIPILLTKPASLPPATITALNRLQPTRIWILGGTVSVSASVETALHTYATTVTRLAGDDRYETAIAITTQFFAPGANTHMFVATGVIFPDALVAGPHADPLLLTRAAALPTGAAPPPLKGVAAEATRLNPNAITVLGGPTLISENVVNQLKAT